MICNRLFVLALGLSLAGMSRAQTPVAPGATPLEPTVQGGYMRIVCDHGIYYGNPMDAVLRSYADMRKSGFDAVFLDPFLAESKGLQNSCNKLKITPESYIATVMQACEENGLDFWTGYAFWTLNPTEPTNRAAILDAVRKDARIYAKSPRFRGFSFDEPTAGSYRTESGLRMFKEWLMKKYAPAELTAMGLGILTNAVVNLVVPPAAPAAGQPEPAAGSPHLFLPAKYEENPVLFMEYEEFCSEQFSSLMTDVEAAVREVKPDTCSFPILSYMAILHAPFRSSVARVGRACGAVSVDPYWDGAQDQAFWAKLMRNQARGPSCLTVSAGRYSGGPNRFARDIANGLVHSPAIDVWCWGYADKKPPLYNAGMMTHYKKGNYDVMARLFRRIDTIKPYLAPSASIAKVAVLYSEREAMWTQAGKVAWPQQGQFVANCHGLHAALAQLGIPYEPLFEELLSTEALRPYEALIVPGVTYLRPESIAALAAWVAAGGELIAMGPVGTRDRWGRPAAPSSFADLTGVACVPISGMDNLVLNAAGQGAITSSYGAALSASKLEPSTATPIGYWTNGTVAAAVNRVGKGSVISLGTDKLGCAYQGRDRVRSYMPRYKDFLPGVLPMLKQVIMARLGGRDKAWPLQTIQCPPEVEVTVRSQPGRYVAHLINYRREPDPIHGAGVELRLPPEAGTNVAAFYPEDMSRAELAVQGANAKVGVRDFDVHEAVVIQYDGKVPTLKEPCPGTFILPAIPSPPSSPPVTTNASLKGAIQ